MWMVFFLSFLSFLSSIVFFFPFFFLHGCKRMEGISEKNKSFGFISLGLMGQLLQWIRCWSLLFNTHIQYISRHFGKGTIFVLSSSLQRYIWWHVCEMSEAQLLV
jgi:hypothetical protein